MYKRGHDLRQDQVILQLLRIMDGFLKAESLDCCMTPYKCVPMVENQGLIQIVRHTTTVANIVQSIVADASRTKRGNLRHKLTSAMEAMCEEKVIVKWLKKQGQLRTHDIRMISQAFLLFPYRGVNSGSDAKKKPHRDLVVDTFARSCSGYCVAHARKDKSDVIPVNQFEVNLLDAILHADAIDHERGRILSTTRRVVYAFDC
jgi:hypothetical protein